MVAAAMIITLLPELTTDVLALTSEHGYTPDEVISIGIALASVLLKEKRLGNRVVIVDANCQQIAEFKEVQPRAISEIAGKYVKSVCPGMANAPAALVVARLELERDEQSDHLDRTNL